MILVAANDTRQADHVRISKQLQRALQDAQKEVHLKLYPPFGRDGHRLFFEVRDSYWGDVVNFLKAELGP